MSRKLVDSRIRSVFPFRPTEKEEENFLIPFRRKFLLSPEFLGDSRGCRARPNEAGSFVRCWPPPRKVKRQRKSFPLKSLLLLLRRKKRKKEREGKSCSDVFREWVGKTKFSTYIKRITKGRKCHRIIQWVGLKGRPFLSFPLRHDSLKIHLSRVHFVFYT